MMQSTAVHLDRVAAIDIIRESRSGYLPQLLVDFPFFVLFVALVFLIGGDLGWVLVGCIIVMAAVSAFSGWEIRRRTEQRQDNAAAQTNFLIEVLRGLVTVKSYAMEPLFLRRYERVMETSAHLTGNLVVAGTFAQSVAGFVSQAAQVAVVAVGALQVIDGAMTIGGIAACMLLTGRALQPLNRAASLWSQYQSVRIARQRLAALRDLPTVPRRAGLVGERLLGRLEFRNVRFGYEPGRPVLDRLNLVIEPGEAVLIAGEEWTGKSSFLSLAARVMLPDEGVILYDGHPADEWDDRWLRSRIGYLAQQPALFEGTILDNLTGFSSDPELIRAVEEAADEIGLTVAVSKLPRGFQTEIRPDMAEALPASIRQQIPIVRCLARDPDVIVMDECNANLDLASDRLFREALLRRKGRTTLLLVSNRPSFQQIADRVLKPGRAPRHSPAALEVE